MAPTLDESGTTKKNAQGTAVSKKTGTSSLRIDLNTGGASRGSGLNVSQ